MNKTIESKETYSLTLNKGTQLIAILVAEASLDEVQSRKRFIDELYQLSRETVISTQITGQLYNLVEYFEGKKLQVVIPYKEKQNLLLIQERCEQEKKSPRFSYRIEKITMDEIKPKTREQIAHEIEKILLDQKNKSQKFN